MSLAIEGQGRLQHIIASPIIFDRTYLPQWKQNESVVLSWLITNIDSALVNQFLDYTIALDL